MKEKIFVNQDLVKNLGEKTYFKVEITLVSPSVNDDILPLLGREETASKILQQVIDNVQKEISESFSDDIESIKVSVVNGSEE